MRRVRRPSIVAVVVEAQTHNCRTPRPTIAQWLTVFGLFLAACASPTYAMPMMAMPNNTALDSIEPRTCLVQGEAYNPQSKLCQRVLWFGISDCFNTLLDFGAFKAAWEEKTNINMTTTATTTTGGVAQPVTSFLKPNEFSSLRQEHARVVSEHTWERVFIDSTDARADGAGIRDSASGVCSWLPKFGKAFDGFFMAPVVKGEDTDLKAVPTTTTTCS